MTQATCSIPGCSGSARARGWCLAHWKRWQRHGDPLGGRGEANPGTTEPCSVNGCHELTYSSSYCQKHYTRVRRHGDPHYVARRHGQGQCDVEDCERQANRRGYCDKHYRRYMKYGDPLGQAEVAYRRIDSAGYARVLAPDNPAADTCGRVCEHRLVMERHLGRPLLPKETVHHVNGVRDDNRLENLELWSSSHPGGQRVEDKVEWAKEILRLYGQLDSA